MPAAGRLVQFFLKFNPVNMPLNLVRLHTLLSSIGVKAKRLTHTQEKFILWNAARLHISQGESRARYERSLAAFWNGHKGRAYRQYNNLSYQIFQVLYGDDPKSLMPAYQFFAPMHFLRMLSYADPVVT